MHGGEALSIIDEKRRRLRRAPSGGARGPLHCRFFAPEAFPAELAAQWDVLADVAAEPNSFSERWFLETSLLHLARTEDIQIGAVVSEDGLLAGLIPLTVKAHYGRIPVRNVQNWRHSNSFLGTPVIRRGWETPFWTALIDALDDRSWACGLLHVDGLVEGGPVFGGLRAAAASLRRPCDIVHRTRRALLRSELSPDAYWEQSVRKKKRKEINRLANRLDELGAVAYATLGPGDDAEPWIEAFLDLERRGWKGSAGSALACESFIADFFRTAALRAHAAGKLDMHRLDLDGRPIAMLVNFLAPPGSFSFKIAFDEDFARFSPGVLIERHNLGILDRAGIGWMDSCAAENHPMIDSLWRERRDIVRVTVPLSGWRRMLVFRACRAAEKNAARARRLIGRGRRDNG